MHIEFTYSLFMKENVLFLLGGHKSYCCTSDGICINPCYRYYLWILPFFYIYIKRSKEAQSSVSWFAPMLYVDPKSTFKQTICSANMLSEPSCSIWSHAYRLWLKFIWIIFDMKNVSRVRVMLTLHHSFAHCKCLLIMSSVLHITPKNKHPRAQLKSITLTQHQGWMPDTPGESKVSVLTQMFRKVWVICQTVHSPLIHCHHEPEASLLFPLLSGATHTCWSMYSLYTAIV